MADTWICPTCKATLRCSCNSSECSFDYDIRAHIRRDIKNAINDALLWIEPAALVAYVQRVVEDHE